MYKTTLAGHPLHPQLILAPGGLLPFSFLMDVMHRATGEQSYADASYHTIWGGFLGGLAAGAAGAVDYFSIPEESRSKRTANVHAGLNSAIIGLYAVNLAMRRRGESPSMVATVLSGIGTAGLLVSAWYGGHMVYEEGMRVKGVDPIEAARELKAPADDAVSETFEKTLSDPYVP